MVRSSLPVLSVDPANLTLQSVEAGTSSAIIYVKATAAQARCPKCNEPSKRIHSRYVRKLADLPWQGQAVHIQVQVRRFFCQGAECPRRIFAERLPFAMPFARTTSRLRDIHAEIGLSLGGEAGARLAMRLAMPTSPDTLLRRIRQTPFTSAQPVRVLGVDDWAFRRGQRYGTILCDLERRCPVDLLPERSAEALCRWLRDHPEVEIVTRDRADDYIKGASEGAPQAVQVADRWHLLRNLSDAMRRIVDRFHGSIRQAVQAMRLATSSLASPEAANATAKVEESQEPPRSTRYEQRQQERRQRRLERYAQVTELHQQGVAQREIARRLAMNRATVARFVQAESFPERASRRVPRRTDQVMDFLQRRWNEGCRNAAQLFAELKAEGFDGSYHMVRRRLARWRQRAASEGTHGKAEAPSSKRAFSPRQIVWLLLKPESELNDAERALRARLEEHSGLHSAAELGRQFREMVRTRQEEVWNDWLKQSQQDTAPGELRNFAKGLQADQAAVREALRSPWSNGQVEGHVNRLKTLKRQMYGRAKFDLLRKRFLRAA
jgi:transposase